MAKRAEIMSSIKQKLLEAEGVDEVPAAQVVAAAAPTVEEILRPWTDEITVIKYLIESLKLAERYGKLIDSELNASGKNETTNGFNSDIAIAESERCYDELAKFFGPDELKILLFS